MYISVYSSKTIKMGFTGIFIARTYVPNKYDICVYHLIAPNTGICFY